MGQSLLFVDDLAEIARQGVRNGLEVGQARQSSRHGGRHQLCQVDDGASLQKRACPDSISNFHRGQFGCRSQQSI
jgi:hypothetical protein